MLIALPEMVVLHVLPFVVGKPSVNNTTNLLRVTLPITFGLLLKMVLAKVRPVSVAVEPVVDRLLT